MVSWGDIKMIFTKENKMSDIMGIIRIKAEEFDQKELERKMAEEMRTKFYFFEDNQRNPNPISKAFTMLDSEQKQIEFCTDLISLWKDKERKDEAKKVFCESGIISSEIFEKFYGYFWGMTLTTWSCHKFDQLRVWVESPASWGKGDYVDSCGRFVFFDLRAPVMKKSNYNIFEKRPLESRLKGYWLSFKSLISLSGNSFDGEFQSGIWLYTNHDVNH